MKHKLAWALAAAAAFGATACVRLNTPEKKAGYAVGESIGHSLERIKDKIAVEQVLKGLSDQKAGTSTMKDDELAQVLGQLQQGADKDKNGYAVGLSIGKNVKPILGYVDFEMIKRGIKDDLAGHAKLDENEVSQTLQTLEQKRQEDESKKNKADGAAFLEQNKAKPGVKVTASGLQYEILRPGHGRKATKADAVKVDYVGTLTDGTKFDSSYDRHQPATFPVTGVIPGWTEGLQLMNVGSKFRFVIPSEIAYGARGAGGQIGPDAVLVFEVELLGFEKAKPQAGPQR